MHNHWRIAVALLAAYLLGSIPFGYLLVRIFRGADVRASGSGNIGATNVARTSRALGIVTLGLDAGKGMAAVLCMRALFPGNGVLAFAAAFAAICGHMFPVWLRFRGGKGVATGLGSFVLLTPKAILIAIGIFIVMLVAFRWVALASITAVAFVPLFAWLIHEIPTREPYGSATTSAFASAPLILLCAASALIIVKHHTNIRRLLAGREPRIGKKRG